MKKTASILAVMLALGLTMAGCSDKDEGMGEAHDTMENAAGDTNHAAEGMAAPDAGMAGEGAAPMDAAPAETAPAEGQ